MESEGINCQGKKDREWLNKLLGNYKAGLSERIPAIINGSEDCQEKRSRTAEPIVGKL